MRRVRNPKNCTNPMVMFSQGVESIVAEKLAHPTHYQDYELDEMHRKEQATAKVVSTANQPKKIQLVELLRELIWPKKKGNILQRS